MKSENVIKSKADGLNEYWSGESVSDPEGSHQEINLSGHHLEKQKDDHLVAAP